MQPSLWNPPRDLSDAEERIVRRVKRAQLFVYLRQQRREILALATILQAYMGISDDEVMEADAVLARERPSQANRLGEDRGGGGVHTLHLGGIATVA